MNDGTTTGNQLTKEWLTYGGNTRRFGPYQHNDRNTPINNNHLDDSIVPLLNATSNDLVRSFFDGSVKHGTALIQVWGKDVKPKLNNEKVEQFISRIKYVVTSHPQ